MSELLPCPFCGAAAEVKGGYPDGYCVVCSRGYGDGECWAAVGENYDQDGYPSHLFGNAEQAIAAWNRRPAQVRVQNPDGSWLAEPALATKSSGAT